MTGLTPTNIPFNEFLARGATFISIAIAIYLYVQKFMSDVESERGFHFKGMVLKYACWPIFFLGFLLSVVNAEIPYIPTAKKASIGSVSPFARPLYLHVALFILSIVSLYLYRKYYITEYDLIQTRVEVWAMIAFASFSFIMSVLGIYAASESKRMTAEDCWDFVDLKNITIEDKTLLKK